MKRLAVLFQFYLNRADTIKLQAVKCKVVRDLYFFLDIFAINRNLISGIIRKHRKQRLAQTIQLPDELNFNVLLCVYILYAIGKCH